MKRFAFFVVVSVAIAFVSVSCSGGSYVEDNVDNFQELTGNLSGLFVLNSGNMGNNDAALAYYDAKDRQVVTNVFANANGKKLGDTGNSMIVYGGKMYVAVSGSSVMFVTDLKGNCLKEITVPGDNANLSPRQFTKAGGKVYVSFMEGYVGAIDTASFEVEKVKVGPMPEGLAYANKKIYVANSDGYNWPYGKTVSVIDAATFTVVKTLEVSNNPQTLHVASDNVVYLVCWGDYGEVPAKLQRINTSTDEVFTIDGVQPTNMAIGKNGVAYILSCVYDENWNRTITCYTFDTVKGRVSGEFMSSEDVQQNGYSIFADEVTGNVYIGASDYINNGDVYIVSPDGHVLDSFDTGALNPIAICPIR